jgi:hypothetical protein
VARPSSRTVQGSIDLMVSIPFWAQLSTPSRSRTACFEGADIPRQLTTSSRISACLETLPVTRLRARRRDVRELCSRPLSLPCGKPGKDDCRVGIHS